MSEISSTMFVEIFFPIITYYAINRYKVYLWVVRTKVLCIKTTTIIFHLCVSEISSTMLNTVDVMLYNSTKLILSENQQTWIYAKVILYYKPSIFFSIPIRSYVFTNASWQHIFGLPKSIWSNWSLYAIIKIGTDLTRSLIKQFE